VIREQLADLVAPEDMPTGDRPQYRAPAPQLTKVDAEGRPVAKPAQRRFGGETGTAAKPRPEKIERKAGWAKAKPKRVFKANPNRKAAKDGERPENARPEPRAKARAARGEAKARVEAPKVEGGKPKRFKPGGSKHWVKGSGEGAKSGKPGGAPPKGRR
jgi:23S rRNA pseudouridine2605 synthase